MSETLYAGIGEICDSAMQHACADGAALAVLSQSAQNRELIYASDSVAQRLDELQYTIGEGPCFDAYLDDSPQFYPELASTVSPSRWPTFAADATEMGAHALFAFPIPDGQQPLGVLELCRRSMGSLDTVQCAAVEGCAQMIADRLLSNWKDHVSRFGDVTHALNAAAASHDAASLSPLTRSPARRFT